jgi:phosphoglycolate phosphatase
MNIVFDLDGTLIDSAPDICAVVNTLLADLGRSFLTVEETRRFVGEGSAVLIRRVMAAREIDDTGGAHAGLLRTFLSRYEDGVGAAAFYPGVPRALEQLRGAGHRLGLCTNKAEGPTRAVLSHVGLDKVFDAVIAGGMIDSRKPEPDMLLHVLVEMGEGRPLYVGDSETDAETARRAGIPFALFSGGYRKTPAREIPHNWLFHHFDSLAGIAEIAAGPGDSAPPRPHDTP